MLCVNLGHNFLPNSKRLLFDFLNLDNRSRKLPLFCFPIVLRNRAKSREVRRLKAVHRNLSNRLHFELASGIFNAVRNVRLFNVNG